MAWHSWSTPQARPSATIDLGTCVGVIQKSGRISTDGIGFRELPSWSVSTTPNEPTTPTGPTTPTTPTTPSTPVTPSTPDTPSTPRKPYIASITNDARGIREVKNRGMSNAYLGYFLVSLDRPVAKEDAPLDIVLTPSTRGPGPIARPDRYHFPNGPKVRIAAGCTSGEVIVEALNDNVVSSTQYVAVELTVDPSNNALLAPYPFASMPLYDNDFWTWEDISDRPSPTTDSGSIGALSFNYTMNSEAFATGEQVVCRASTALKATINDAYLPWCDTTLQVTATQQVSFAIDRNDPSGTIRVVRGGVDEDTKDDAATAIGVTVSPANNPNDRVRTALITFEMNVGVKTKYVKTGSWTGSGSELGGKDVTNDFGTFSTSVTFQGTTESQKGMSRTVTKQYTVSATVTELDDE